MKELLEQYNRIQATATGLRHVSQDIPGLVDDHTIEVMINKIGLRMHTLAHEIVRELQQQLDGDAKQADTQDTEWNGNGPGPINNVLHKPLWAVIPADAEDDVWQKQLGPRKQVSYQLFLTKQHAEEYASQLRKSKVVPVWGE